MSLRPKITEEDVMSRLFLSAEEEEWDQEEEEWEEEEGWEEEGLGEEEEDEW